MIFLSLWDFVRRLSTYWGQSRTVTNWWQRIAGYFARRTQCFPDAFSYTPQVLSSSLHSSLDCRAGRGRPFLKGEDKFAVPALAEKKTHTVLDETHSRADGLMMDSSTMRCLREEDPPVDGGDSLETRRTVVGKANVARISFLVILNEDLLRFPARGSDAVKIISSAGWPSQRMLPVPQRC